MKKKVIMRKVQNIYHNDYLCINMPFTLTSAYRSPGTHPGSPGYPQGEYPRVLEVPTAGNAEDSGIPGLDTACQKHGTARCYLSSAENKLLYFGGPSQGVNS